MPAPTRTSRNYTAPSNANSLKTHLQGVGLTICTCWKVTSADGTRVLGFTSLDQDLAGLTGHSGVTFKHATGLSPSAIESASGLAVPNQEVDAILSSNAITEADILRGFWDYAAFEVFVVNWRDLSMGDLLMHAGTFGEISLLGDQFRAEGLGLNRAAQMNIGATYMPDCDVDDFGDTRCGLTLVANTHYFDVTTATDPGGTSNIRFYCATVPGGGFTFTNGKVKFNGGGVALSGATIEIKSWDAATGRFDLKFPAQGSIPAGTSIRLTVGCDRSRDACALFANILNHRGFPDVPGLEHVYHINRVN